VPNVNETSDLPISLAQAREIALEALHQAEAERRNYAEKETRKGIDWESAAEE